MWRKPKHTNDLWKILEKLLPNWKSFCIGAWFAWTFLNNIKRTKTVHQEEILKLIILIKKLEEKHVEDIKNIQLLKDIVKDRIWIIL